MSKYERSLFVECSCGTINELPTDEGIPLEIAGLPINLAEGKCSKCGKEIIVYASIWIH